jgi:Zn-dependent protease
VFLLEPAHTPYDLKFRLFGIPVRVHPMFWLVMAVLGWGSGPGAPDPMFLPGLLVWVAACFVSVLIHELGHIFMRRFFGSDGHIVLYSFGGLAIGNNALSGGGRRALVSFAGPLAQFLLLGIVVLVLWFAYVPAELRPLLASQPARFVHVLLVLPGLVTNELLQRFFEAMVFINLFWPLLNLLPIWPLDGGQIAREGFVGLLRERGLGISLGVSLLVATLLAVNALLAIPNARGEPLIPGLGHGGPFLPVVGEVFAGGWFMVLLFAMLALQSFQLLRALDAERRWRDDRWEE